MYVFLNKRALEDLLSEKGREEKELNVHGHTSGETGHLKFTRASSQGFGGYFTLVQCCREQTERVIPLSLCGQTLRRDYNSFLSGEKLVWCCI